jgi:PIN domain nuclease of toxin-antitoxin system
VTGLLLDSHVLLWSLAQPERLSPRARELIVGEQSTLHFSVASLWEIAVKLSIGKLELPNDWLDQMLSRMSDWGVRWLAISPRHCARLAVLPFHHKDPFDRMLIAQAGVEGLSLISADATIDAYDIERVW